MPKLALAPPLTGHSALVVVPMVKVRNVWVGVHEFAVLMDVAVATVKSVGVGVIVVAVIVGVLVGVDHHVMVMLVEVVGSQREADSERGDRPSRSPAPRRSSRRARPTTTPRRGTVPRRRSPVREPRRVAVRHVPTA